MFYVKSQINEDAHIKIDITDENVFCTCPQCGSEVLVDLAEVFQDGEIDLFGTDVYCTECSKEIRSYE
ncbi:hypothetical protein [Clostridium botulinum]|uniref:hypothetical protein n=1 Tax=Clostridium botulinum TaxID=1491 RepID=UPI0006A47FD3|nr:hypothetical protein [Clostridium botulinum]KOC45771.1 hypothetical protein ADU88_13335 [Clostridium botulinum]